MGSTGGKGVKGGMGYWNKIRRDCGCQEVCARCCEVADCPLRDSQENPR